MRQRKEHVAWMEDPARDASGDDGDPRGEIARLEARIEALADTIERCRKIALASKAALVAGTAWMLLILVGAVAPQGASLIGAMTLMIGGFVAFGSNTSTARQAAAGIAAAEQRRAELIGRIDLQVVSDRR
jgi:hypothetical protein